MSDKISVIIPCYWANQYLVDITARCLDGLRGFDGTVVVVDDCSPIKPLFEYTCLQVSNDVNKGYAGAVNKGLEHATGDILIVSNNDIEFIQPDWLDHLLKPLEDGYDISMIRTTDGDGWTTEDKITEGDKFGSIWAMKREVYETLGNLDEGFGKGYFEDLDYWRRAIDAGFKIAKNHNGLVEHKGKATFSTLNLGQIYNSAMVKYKEKHPDAVLFTQVTDGVMNLLLTERLDFNSLPESTQKEMLTNTISVDEAKKLWELDAD